MPKCVWISLVNVELKHANITPPVHSVSAFYTKKCQYSVKLQRCVWERGVYYALHSTFPSHLCPFYLLHCLRQWWWCLSWNYLLCLLLHTVAVLLGLHLVWLRTWYLSSWMGLWYETENIPYCFRATLTENLFIYARIFEWQQIKISFTKKLHLDNIKRTLVIIQFRILSSCILSQNIKIKINQNYTLAPPPCRFETSSLTSCEE